jgi:hypothetical protein
MLAEPEEILIRRFQVSVKMAQNRAQMRKNLQKIFADGLERRDYQGSLRQLLKGICRIHPHWVLQIAIYPPNRPFGRNSVDAGGR